MWVMYFPSVFMMSKRKKKLNQYINIQKTNLINRASIQGHNQSTCLAVSHQACRLIEIV